MRERPAPAAQNDNLREYVVALRRHKWLIAAITLLVLGIVMVRSYLQPPIYQSQARLLLRYTQATGYLNMQTESQLVSSEPVAEAAAEQLEYEGDPSTLLNGLAVAVSTDTEILVINYTSSDPEEAQARAQAFAVGYIEHRESEIIEDLRSAAERFSSQISTLNRLINELNKDILNADDEGERATMQTEINTLVSQLALLEQQRATLTSPAEIEIGQVVQPATFPGSPFSPNHTQNAILGLFFGALMGVGGALLRERLDERLRGRHDLEARLGRPILAVIPRVPSWRRSKEAVLVSMTEPHSVASEAYKTLRTSTLFAASSRGLKVLLVAGPHPSEGKTVTLANLGVALANADRRIIIASADLRRPRLHEFFGLRNDHGITSILAGDDQITDALQRVGVDNLRVLPSGPPPSNPAEVLGSEGMGELLAELREVADLVLLDSPPILGVADALIVAPLTDGVIFVVDPGRSNRHSVSHAAQELEQIDVHILGGVLNNFDRLGHPYAYYQVSPEARQSRATSEQPSARRRFRRQARR